MALGSQNALMTHSIWILMPWAIFAVAAAIKFWHLTTLFRKHLIDTPSSTEQIRDSLERIWQKDQQAV